MRSSPDRSMRQWRISKEDCLCGAGRAVPDLVAFGLRVLLVGINPSNCSGATGYHFATPRNRLWPVLAGSGFTDRQLCPDETAKLLAAGIGISNLVNRATRAANEVSDQELMAGAVQLRATIRSFRPQAVAILGVSAYRVAFSRRSASIGRQPSRLEGTDLWVLPNPSGLNTHYSTLALISLFAEFRMAIS